MCRGQGDQISSSPYRDNGVEAMGASAGPQGQGDICHIRILCIFDQITVYSNKWLLYRSTFFKIIRTSQDNLKGFKKYISLKHRNFSSFISILVSPRTDNFKLCPMMPHPKQK